MFIMETCPYCRQALSWMDELRKENPKYSGIDIKIVDEVQQSQIANEYDYFYVPTYFVNGEKVHEGAATKDAIRGVLEKAVQ